MPSFPQGLEQLYGIQFFDLNIHKLIILSGQSN